MVSKISLIAKVLGIATASLACYNHAAAAENLPLQTSTDSPSLTQNADRRITVTLSIHWEGQSINAYNLEAIKNFRQRFSGVNFVHFVDPAYFLKPGVNQDKIQEMIKSTIQAGDIVGLQIHGWQSLIREAKVVFRDSPTFWGQPISTKECSFDCGHEVPINVYSVAELRQIIKTGADVLEKAGFPRPTYFMAGGWVSSDNVQEAAVQEGMIRDYSPIPPSLVYGRLRGYPLFGWINNLWESTLPFSLPYEKKFGSDTLAVMPFTAGTVDYLRSQDVIEIMRTNINMVTEGGKPGPLYFHVGMYQETALAQVKKMEQIVQAIFALSTKAGVALEFDSTGGGVRRDLQTRFHSPGDRVPL
jgi:hypothetical protein